MPTILREAGFRLFFYSNEGTEPAHVHIQYAGAVAKFWLNPVLLASNLGMNAKELSSAAKIVKKHEKTLKEKWDEFFRGQ